MLYVEAAMLAAQGNDSETESKLYQRYQIGLEQQEGVRYVMPYLAVLVENNDFKQALALFNVSFPNVSKGQSITVENYPQFLSLSYLLKASSQHELSSALFSAVSDYLSSKTLMEVTIPYIFWLVESGQHQLALEATEKLLYQGWLPDFNDNIYAASQLQRLYTRAGGQSDKFEVLLKHNRSMVLNH